MISSTMISNPLAEVYASRSAVTTGSNELLLGSQSDHEYRQRRIRHTKPKGTAVLRRKGNGNSNTNNNNSLDCTSKSDDGGLAGKICTKGGHRNNIRKVRSTDDLLGSQSEHRGQQQRGRRMRTTTRRKPVDCLGSQSEHGTAHNNRRNLCKKRLGLGMNSSSNHGDHGDHNIVDYTKMLTPTNQQKRKLFMSPTPSKSMPLIQKRNYSTRKMLSPSKSKSMQLMSSRTKSRALLSSTKTEKEAFDSEIGIVTRKKASPMKFNDVMAFDNDTSDYFQNDDATDHFHRNTTIHTTTNEKKRKQKMNNQQNQLVSTIEHLRSRVGTLQDHQLDQSPWKSMKDEVDDGSSSSFSVSLSSSSSSISSATSFFDCVESMSTKKVSFSLNINTSCGGGESINYKQRDNKLPTSIELSMELCKIVVPAADDRMNYYSYYDALRALRKLRDWSSRRDRRFMKFFYQYGGIAYILNFLRQTTLVMNNDDDNDDNSNVGDDDIHDSIGRKKDVKLDCIRYAAAIIDFVTRKEDDDDDNNNKLHNKLATKNAMAVLEYFCDDVVDNEEEDEDGLSLFSTTGIMTLLMAHNGCIKNSSTDQPPIVTQRSLLRALYNIVDSIPLDDEEKNSLLSEKEGRLMYKAGIEIIDSLHRYAKDSHASRTIGRVFGMLGNLVRCNNNTNNYVSKEDIHRTQTVSKCLQIFINSNNKWTCRCEVIHQSVTYFLYHCVQNGLVSNNNPTTGSSGTDTAATNNNDDDDDFKRLFNLFVMTFNEFPSNQQIRNWTSYLLNYTI